MLLLVVPGPAVSYIVARSIADGRRAGLVSVLGIHIGSVVHVVAAVVGLSALIASSALAYNSIRLVGAAYLVFLGVARLLRKDSPEHLQAESAPLRRVFAQGIVVNVLNPKTSLFFLAFLPQFIDPGRGSVALQTLVLGLTFIVLGMLSDSTYAFVAAAAAGLMRKSARFRRAERWASGGTLIALGLSAGLSGGRPQKA